MSLIDHPPDQEGLTDQNFLVVEYRALRQEICDIKGRLVRIMGLGIIGTPIFIGAAMKMELQPVVILSPIVPVAFMFLLLLEQNALMRAGRYIKDYIEPKLGGGWEKFIAETMGARQGERYFSWAACLIFAMYYWIGMLQSFRQIKNIELGRRPLHLTPIGEELLQELVSSIIYFRPSFVLVTMFAIGFFVVFPRVWKHLRIST